MKFYEEDIKEVILNKKHLFIEEDEKHTILFEKGIVINSVIADCLIFSENKGIIGVEVKTERDNTRRLNRQLNGYNRVCDYVYVLAHDDHVEKVEEILNKHGHIHVGIIAYTEFKGEAILGIYKEASRSPKKDVRMAWQMLWRQEIVNILGSFKRQVKTLEEKSLKVNTVKSRSSGLHGLYVQSNASSKYLKKSHMIDMIVNMLGSEEANRLLCNIFISGKKHPEKQLRFYHFKEKTNK